MTAELHAVVALPPATEPDRACAALAASLGGSPYDHRQTLLKNVPWIVAWRPHQAALALAAECSGAGLPTRMWTADELADTPEPFLARSFRLGARGFEVSGRAGERVLLLYAKVALVLRARAEQSTTTTIETVQRKTSMAALAIGLPIATTKRTTERDTAFQQSWFALVYGLDPDVCIRLDRDVLEYGGLGPAMAGGAIANWLALLGAIEAACPGATRDGRLEKAAGKLVGVPLEVQTARASKDRKTKVSTTTMGTDNAGAIDFAAMLLFLAERARRSAR
ncbi:MAG: hypothetical protein EXR79_15000 [Myxococcales bacterium]|nr:hypothetical protein [Myxococcales bacterium]